MAARGPHGVGALAPPGTRRTGQSASSRSLRITPHRPELRACAGTWAGACAHAFGSRRPGPRPRATGALSRGDPLHALTAKNVRRTEHNTPPQRAPKPPGSTRPRRPGRARDRGHRPRAVSRHGRTRDRREPTHARTSRHEAVEVMKGAESAGQKTMPPAGDRPAPGGRGRAAGCGSAVVARAPIPSTVDPGKAEQTWPLVSRSFVQWRAPPGHQGPCPLHCVWVDGGRDGSWGWMLGAARLPRGGTNTVAHRGQLQASWLVITHNDPVQPIPRWRQHSPGRICAWIPSSSGCRPPWPR